MQLSQVWWGHLVQPVLVATSPQWQQQYVIFISLFASEDARRNVEDDSADVDYEESDTTGATQITRVE